jgi:hypothetical protein
VGPTLIPFQPCQVPEAAGSALSAYPTPCPELPRTPQESLSALSGQSAQGDQCRIQNEGKGAGTVRQGGRKKGKRRKETGESQRRKKHKIKKGKKAGCGGDMILIPVVLGG